MTDAHHDLGEEAQVAAPVASAPRGTRADLADQYHAALLHNLRVRHGLNALMIAVVEGSGTIEEFGAYCTAHEQATRDAGAALTCLGALGGSEGVA